MKQTKKPDTRKPDSKNIDQLTREAFESFEPKKRNMLIALVHTMGIVTSAAKQAKIHFSSHYNWMNKEHASFDPEYKKQVDALNNLSLDFAETQLLKLIRGQNVAAVIFYLKTKGKARGYVEKQIIGFDPNDESEIESTLSI